jgi:hypothetical protein
MQAVRSEFQKATSIALLTTLCWGCEDAQRMGTATGADSTGGAAGGAGVVVAGSGGAHVGNGGTASDSGGSGFGGAEGISTGGATGGAGTPSGGSSPEGLDASAPPMDIILFEPPETDAGSEPFCSDPPCECSAYSFSIDTRQSCALDLNELTADPGALPLDAESFIEIQSTPFRVFAMDRWGAGHVLAWCDGTTFDELVKQIPVFEYLGQTASPRIASVGYEFFCGASHTLGTEDYGFTTDQVTYLGTALPAEYLDDPAALAADWDGLLVCVNGADWTTDFSDTVRRFVRDEGRGVAIVGEYQSPAEEQAKASDYILGTGIEFQALSLPWAPSATAVDLDCVADVPVIIR